MKKLSLALVVVLASPALWAGEPDTAEEFIARMEVEHATDAPIASPAAREEPATDVTAQTGVYATVEGKQIEGYVAHPADTKPTAGLIVIHEWWGLNDNIRAMTRRFAGEGYLALAVDLYEGEVAEDRETAGTLARASAERRSQLVDNLRQAVEHLRQGGAQHIGVIGWCYGGGWSLRTALSFPDEIDAAVIYYGRVSTDSKELDKLQAPLLGIFGALDKGIPVTTVREFQSVLDRLGKPAAIHIYEGADHAFANPSGTRYNANAAKDAWAKTIGFFGEHLR